MRPDDPGGKPQQSYGVPDEENPEWTAEEIRTAKPFGEVFPDLADVVEGDTDGKD